MTADLDLRAARRRIWLQADSPRTIRLNPRDKATGEPVDATAFTLVVSGTPQPVEPVATDPEVGERRFTFTPEHSAQVAAAKAATWALRHADAGVVATGPLVATTDGTIAGVDDAVLEVFVGDSTWVVELAPILGGGGGGSGVHVGPTPPEDTSRLWARTGPVLAAFVDYRVFPDGPAPESTPVGGVDIVDAHDQAPPGVFSPMAVVDGALRTPEADGTGAVALYMIGPRSDPFRVTCGFADFTHREGTPTAENSVNIIITDEGGNGPVAHAYAAEQGGVLGTLFFAGWDINFQPVLGDPVFVPRLVGAGDRLGLGFDGTHWTVYLNGEPIPGIDPWPHDDDIVSLAQLTVTGTPMPGWGGRWIAGTHWWALTDGDLDFDPDAVVWLRHDGTGWVPMGGLPEGRVAEVARVVAPVRSVDGRVGEVDLSDTYEPLGAPSAPAPVWELVEERVLAEDANHLDFTGLDEFAEVEIRWSARCVNTSGSQVPLLARFNGDSDQNYSFAQSGRIVNTNLLSNTTAQNAGYLGYVAASQTNTDRWSTGTITLRLDQPANARKVAMGTCVFGQSTGDNIGQADIGLEWANTTDPIETLRLFCSADLVAGSRFTVLGRR